MCFWVCEGGGAFSVVRGGGGRSAFWGEEVCFSGGVWDVYLAGRGGREEGCLFSCWVGVFFCGYVCLLGGGVGVCVFFVECGWVCLFCVCGWVCLFL